MGTRRTEAAWCVAQKTRSAAVVETADDLKWKQVGSTMPSKWR